MIPDFVCLIILGVILADIWVNDRYKCLECERRGELRCLRARYVLESRKRRAGEPEGEGDE